jgi:hypothetical protein
MGKRARRTSREEESKVNLFLRKSVSPQRFSPVARPHSSRAFYSRGGSERIPIRRRSWIFDTRIERIRVSGQI